jgi:hypothetical protein
MLILTVVFLVDPSAPKEDIGIDSIVTTVMLAVAMGIFLIVRRLPDRSPAAQFVQRRVLLEGFSCTGCGGGEFVRQDASMRAAMKRQMRIRCTGCGRKFFSSPELWSLLPPARLDDRFLDADDENAIVAQAPLSALQILICLIGVAIGVTPAILYMVLVDRGDGAGTALFWIGLLSAYLMMWLPIRVAWRFSLRYSPLWRLPGSRAPTELGDIDLPDPKA